MTRGLAALAALLTGAALAQVPADLGLSDPGQARREVTASRTEERGILEELAGIDESLRGVRDGLDNLEARAEHLEETRARHEAEVATTSAAVQAQRDEATERLRALYRLQRRGVARVMFDAEDPTDLRRRGQYLRAVLRADRERLAQFAGLAARRSSAEAALQADVDALAQARKALGDQEASLREQRARRLDLLDEIRTRRELAQQLVVELGATRQDLGQRLGGAPQPDATSPGATPTAAAAPTRFREAYGRLPWPAAGRVLRGFGPSTDPITGAPSDSLGIDIAAAAGEPVRAVFAGTVKLAEYVRGYGQTVAVEHGAYTTVYAHLGGLRVRPEQAVTAGDVVGLAGDTGLASGAEPVLTFELRYNGTPQDPSPWLASR